MAAVSNGSLVTLRSSRKYSTSGPERPVGEEKVAVIWTVSLERMITEPSEDWPAAKASTMGRGAGSCTEFVRPGVGPVFTGEASQLAGSLGEVRKLTRSRERPRNWKFDEFSPVHSSSAPRASAPMAHGKPGE